MSIDQMYDDKKLEIKSLLCCAQEIIQRFLAVDAHPVRQHHQPPDAFADFMLQTGFIRITDRPTSLLRHGQAPNQARIRQKRQRILFHGPFTTVVLQFQRVVMLPDFFRSFSCLFDCHVFHIIPQIQRNLVL